MMQQRACQFFSEGYELQAEVFLPDGTLPDGGLPTLIPCSGYQGLRSFYPRLFARALTRRGFACLGFDYRGFARSQGTTGRVILEEQKQDILSAVTYTLMQPEVKPHHVGLIGWGMGAPLVLQAAASDPRIAGVAALNGFYVGRRWLENVHGSEKMEVILQKVEKDRRRRVRGLPSAPIEAFAHYPLDPLTRKHVEVELGRKKEFGGPVTVEFTDSILKLNAEEAAFSLKSRPVLVAHGRENKLHPISEARSLCRQFEDPPDWFEIDGGHNDFMYADHPEFLRLADKLAAFFSDLWR